MTQEAFQESSQKELGRLEAQLASLRQELAALTLRQNSVADEVGLLPQKIQAARADVSWNYPEPCGTSYPLGNTHLGAGSVSLGSILSLLSETTHLGAGSVSLGSILSLLSETTHLGAGSLACCLQPPPWGRRWRQYPWSVLEARAHLNWCRPGLWGKCLSFLASLP